MGSGSPSTVRLTDLVAKGMTGSTTRLEALTAEPIAHITAALQHSDEYTLAYAVLRDWRGEEPLTDNELAIIFELVIESEHPSSANDVKAVLEADTDWVDSRPTGFLRHSKS